MADRGPNDLPWACHHPHPFSEYRDDKGTVYVASPKLDLGDHYDWSAIAGCGVFPKFDRKLVLTAPDGTGVSQWRLPQWFYPDGHKPPLTYHPDRRRWRHDADHAYLRSIGRGQEFVLDLAHYPKAVEWVAGLVSSLGSNTRR